VNFKKLDKKDIENIFDMVSCKIFSSFDKINNNFTINFLGDGKSKSKDLFFEFITTEREKNQFIFNHYGNNHIVMNIPSLN
jgi:hypothetical protein